jgi:hypothetical protein
MFGFFSFIQTACQMIAGFCVKRRSRLSDILRMKKIAISNQHHKTHEAGRFQASAPGKIDQQKGQMEGKGAAQSSSASTKETATSKTENTATKDPGSGGDVSKKKLQKLRGRVRRSKGVARDRWQ